MINTLRVLALPVVSRGGPHTTHRWPLNHKIIWEPNSEWVEEREENSPHIRPKDGWKTKTQ